MTDRKVGRWFRSDAGMERARVYDRARSQARTKRAKSKGLCRTCVRNKPTNGTRQCDRCKLKAACRLVVELRKSNPALLTLVRQLLFT